MTWDSPCCGRVRAREGAISAGVAAALILWGALTPRVESQEPDTFSAAPVVPALEPSHVVGPKVCLDCHKSEYLAWMQTMHFDDHRLEGQRAQELIDAYGDSQVCFQCHKTPQRDRLGRVLANTGVSCESCHGAAGGQQGWLNRHAVYGPNLTRMSEESAAHYESRLAFCDAAGMIRAARIDEVARNCYACHIVGDEQLLQAGHKTGQAGFELIPWIQGEVRHNFHLNQQVNSETPSLLTTRFGRTQLERQRVMFVVDYLVRIEICLRNFAAADTENLGSDYAQEWVDRIESANDDFEEFVLELLEDAEIEEPELTAAFEEVAELEFDRTREDQAAAWRAADTVGAAATRFVERHDGSRLEVLDENWEFLGEIKGDVFQR